MPFNVIGKAVNNVISSFNSSPVAQAFNTINNISNAVSSINDFTSAAAFVSSNRMGTALQFGAAQAGSSTTTARLSSTSDLRGNDWRVRIHLPASPIWFLNSPILKPLKESNASLVFPTTPQILLSSQANYDSFDPTHSNYPYYIYQNSRIEDITISAEFPVENEADGAYWIAAVHFLRSITKMFYGNSEFQGHPPPRVAMSGYGDFIFDETPVVVKMFNLDLPNAVDYIKVPLGSNSDLSSEIPEAYIAGSKYSYVPTLSTINVTVAPAYSRTATREFDLQSFIKGDYIGNTKPGGFI